jgi:hypothetical protein
MEQQIQNQQQFSEASIEDISEQFTSSFDVQQGNTHPKVHKNKHQFKESIHCL